MSQFNKYIQIVTLSALLLISSFLGVPNSSNAAELCKGVPTTARQKKLIKNSTLKISRAVSTTLSNWRANEVSLRKSIEEEKSIREFQAAIKAYNTIRSLADTLESSDAFFLVFKGYDTEELINQGTPSSESFDLVDIQPFIDQLNMGADAAARAHAIWDAYEADLLPIKQLTPNYTAQRAGFVVLKQKYETALAEALAKIQTLTNEIAILNNQISVLDSQIATLRAQIAGILSAIQQAETRRAAAVSLMGIAQDEIALLMTVDPLDTSIPIWQQIIDSMLIVIGLEDAQITSLNAQIAPIRSQITQLEQQRAILVTLRDQKLREKELLEKVDVPLRNGQINAMIQLISVMDQFPVLLDPTLTDNLHNIVNSQNAFNLFQTAVQQALQELTQGTQLLDAMLADLAQVGSDVSDGEMLSGSSFLIGGQYEGELTALLNGTQLGRVREVLKNLDRSINFITPPSIGRTLKISSRRPHLRARSSLSGAKCKKKLAQWRSFKKALDKATKSTQAQVPDMMTELSRQFLGGPSHSEMLQSIQNAAL